MEIATWAQKGTNFNGYFVNFSAQLIDLLREKRPNNYSMEIIREYEQKYSDIEKEDNKKTPDIIVIMNESFADLNVLGDKIRTNDEVMPFYDSLNNNTIKGYALSSVFGGGTANSEYECLTGNTMGFMTEGASVYQLYLRKPGYSMASYLNKLNYKCIATHPYLSDGWSRTRAWPLLGFDEITFIEDYPQEKLVRDYVSDQEMYEYITELYEKKTNDEKLFLFGITMQNHGGYIYEGEGYTPTISLSGYKKKYPDVEQYLGCINESDKALKYLVEYFEHVDNEVVIMFFGDHLPAVDPEFMEEVHGGLFDTMEEQQLQYTVPFFVWTNYDIEEQNVKLTSLNFLSNYVYQAADIEIPPYNQMLLDVSERIPAMNAFGYYSSEDNKFKTYEDAEGEEAELLNMYENLQYNSLFEKKTRSEMFFQVTNSR